MRHKSTHRGSQGQSRVPTLVVGVEEAINCWEEGAYEAETLETLAEFGD